MTPAVVYDTETTGLPLFKEPSEHPDQPHIVQLAAMLVDLDTHNVLQTIDVTIKPDGWTIPDEAARIHGITTELAGDIGMPESLAVEMLLELCQGRMRIAHNEAFDSRIVRIACMRHFDPQSADDWKAGEAYCTMQAALPIMKLPPTDRMRAAGFTRPKQPTLGEAVSFFTGRGLDNAHNAMADVRGCWDVYQALQDRQAGQPVAA